MIPYGVGVDIGCRMCMTLYDIPAVFERRHTDRIKKMLIYNARFGNAAFERPMDHEVLHRALFGEINLYLDHKNVLQPDLIYLSNERSHIITERGIEGVPDLGVEIISASNSIYDRNTKRLKYMDLGVTEYWIIDPAYRSLEIYHPKSANQPESYIIGEGKVKSAASKSIQFDLKEIF